MTMNLGALVAYIKTFIMATSGVELSPEIFNLLTSKSATELPLISTECTFSFSKNDLFITPRTKKKKTPVTTPLGIK